ncbi:MAG: ABC transporter substrate-binding protein [Geminicoccaceae bacterium]
MRITSLIAGFLAAALLTTSWSAWAQESACDENYTIEGGDSLSRIADRFYGDRDNWSLIFYSNRSAIGENPSLISVGTEIWIPCPGDELADGELPEANTENAEVELLTASDYRPFTDQSLPFGGMVTRIVAESFASHDDAPTFKIDWIDDWSSHLSPLLERRMFDMGFPWLRPPCVDDPETKIADCPRKAFHFSDPIFEMLIVNFVRQADNFDPATDKDLHGKRLCRPDGYFTFDLEDRGLISGDTITLVQPQTVAECFQLLVDEEVEVVTLNEFTGRDAIENLDLHATVAVSDKLATVQGLYLIVHKLHPRATVFMHHFNRGLRKLREEGRLDEIVAEHLAEFYGA